MKEYKYKINGNSYKVTIGDIEDNIAHVEVNGTHYKVEMEKQPKPVAKPVTVRPMPNAPAAPTQTDRSVYRKIRSKISAAGCDPRHQSECRRYCKERTDHYHIGSHEDGKQYQCG